MASQSNARKKYRNKRTRFIIAFVLGLGSTIIFSYFVETKLALILGWDAVALSLVSMIWYDFSGHDGESTEQIAHQDDMSKTFLDSVLTVGALASVAAVAYLLTSGDKSLTNVGIGLASIIITWACVHSIYTLRYAVAYYKGTNGGIDFGSNHSPNFMDFAYVAFTIGMTYQVSDTAFTTTKFRKLAIKHALLSFLFGTAIIATTINFVASLSS
jgi:uncharacterized membrane protein